MCYKPVAKGSHGKGLLGLETHTASDFYDIGKKWQLITVLQKKTQKENGEKAKPNPYSSFK